MYQSSLNSECFPSSRPIIEDPAPWASFLCCGRLSYSFLNVRISFHHCILCAFTVLKYLWGLLSFLQPHFWRHLYPFHHSPLSSSMPRNSPSLGFSGCIFSISRVAAASTFLWSSCFLNITGVDVSLFYMFYFPSFAALFISVGQSPLQWSVFVKCYVNLSLGDKVAWPHTLLSIGTECPVTHHLETDRDLWLVIDHNMHLFLTEWFVVLKS